MVAFAAASISSLQNKGAQPATTQRRSTWTLIEAGSILILLRVKIAWSRVHLIRVFAIFWITATQFCTRNNAATAHVPSLRQKLRGGAYVSSWPRCKIAPVYLQANRIIITKGTRTPTDCGIGAGPPRG